MNVLKLALLGTAAVAAVSVSARADDLSDMKAQIEALNSRIASLESSPAVPAGYSLLSVSEVDAIIIPSIEADKDYGKKATNIGILPTADVPASTNIQWSGFVRAGIVLDNTRKTPGVLTLTTGGIVPGVTTKSNSVDVVSRAGIKVVGTTDTAVGEVGVRVALLGTVENRDGLNRSHAAVTTDGYWGWWKMTPELTLGGGVDGTLANSSNAFDNRCSCAYIATGGAFGHNDPTQIRLSYASGPISFAVAIEDEDDAALSSKNFGFAGEMKYAGDSVGFDLNAGYWDGANSALDNDAAWTVNAGANMALGDIASLGLAIGVGEDNHLAGNLDRYAKASVFLGFTLSDSISAELGGAYTDYKGAGKAYAVGAGLYYTPVSQLTLGLEASYAKSSDVATSSLTATTAAVSSSKSTVADIIAIWRF
jgi:hypothetical protein